MNKNQAIEALKTGAKVVGVTENGHKYEGVLEDMFVIAPVGYNQMGQVHPVNAPAGDWGPVQFRLTFLVDASKSLYSSVTLTAEQMELAEPSKEQIRKDFEDAAYSGYVSRGVGDTDGWFRPIDRTSFEDAMRLRVPVNPQDFTRYNDTEFRPTEEQCAAYNATFLERPKELRLAVRYAKGWKTTKVTGTEAAHELLSSLAEEFGFLEARLEDYAMLDGYWVPVRVIIHGSFVPNNKAITNKRHIRQGDRFRTFAKLLENSETLELDC